MFIAAYAGMGKTIFAKKFPDKALDLCSMPYCWLLPDEPGTRKSIFTQN